MGGSLLPFFASIGLNVYNGNKSTGPFNPYYGGSREDLYFSLLTTDRCVKDLIVSVNFSSKIYPQLNNNIGYIHSYNTSGFWYFPGYNFCRY